MTHPFVAIKNAAFDSIADWAQTNTHLETMQVRVGDVLNLLYGKEPTDNSDRDQAYHTTGRCAGALALVFAACDRIPEDRYIDTMNAMLDIASPKAAQYISTHCTNRNKH